MNTCHCFLDDLTSFPSSLVINVSSPASYQPIPYMAVYAASKAFIQSFSQALHGEWKDRGVLVQTLVPGPTESEFDITARAYESALTKRSTPAQVVDAYLARLDSGLPVITAAKGTYKQRFFAGLFPPSMVIREVGKMFTPPK
jgi:short-subunit dehydrogenase